MQVPLPRDIEQRLRIPDHRIGQKPAVGKNGERVAESGRILGDLPRGIGPFGNQPIEKVDGIVRIRQRGQQRRNASGRGRRKFSEIDKFRARTNRVAELDLVEEIQHYTRL